METKDIIINLNLRNHTDPQLFHLEIKEDYKIALMGVITGKKLRWFNRRYQIQSIKFHIENLKGSRKKLYIKNLEFTGFDGPVTKLYVQLTDIQNDGCIFSNVISVYNNTILRVEFPKEDEQGNLLKINNEILELRKNVGDHICDSRIVF